MKILLATLHVRMLLMLLAFSVSVHTQYSDAEKQAFKISKSIVERIDTVVLFTVYGTHGEPIPKSVRIILSFNAHMELARAEHVYDDTKQFREYYFSNGKLVLATWTDDDHIVTYEEDRSLRNITTS